MTCIGRSSGRNAVAAAAYRSATKLLNEHNGLTYNYSSKKGVELTEIVLPDGVNAPWARDRSVLWNAAERKEIRRNSRVAIEFLVALPHELTREQRTALTRDFARDLANRNGAAIDVAIHRPCGETDSRNVHAHLLMTTRTIGAAGLEEKILFQRKNGWLLAQGLATTSKQLREIRQAWEHHANRHLALAGLDIRVDHRSYRQRGISIEPTQHMGVHATQMARRGLAVSRVRIEKEAARHNAELILKQPEQVLQIITGEKSVFDRHDVARALHRYIDVPQVFENAFAATMASPALVELCPERNGKLARYSTQEMISLEHALVASSQRMADTSTHLVHRRHVDEALRVQDDVIRNCASVAGAELIQAATPNTLPDGAAVEEEHGHLPSGLTHEQRAAVDHITGPQQIAAVVGLAGAGKSTMLAAARDAWERQGYQVHGGVLAGKAAEELHISSGIASSTLASLEYRWHLGRGLLGKQDVLVIDEAGMIGSRQLARILKEVERQGAKLVLVGDHEQLQAIGAGSPFRVISERIGAIELSEIRRQGEGWQREASKAFATHRTAEGLAAYADHGAVQFARTKLEAQANLICDYISDLENHRSGSRIALAHRRADVCAINNAIRASLQERGWLPPGKPRQAASSGNLDGEVVYNTLGGNRAFAAGDRILFLENDRSLGVKSGMLGTVKAVEVDVLQVRLDIPGRRAAPALSIPAKRYRAFDYGYATTIHKSQGATVDRSFVMASGNMDRHLTYVAMTRHRMSARLYAGRDELKDMKSLTASVSRCGVKETILDYSATFAQRRGLARDHGLHPEMAIGVSRAEKQPPAHYSALENDVGSPAALQSSRAADVQAWARKDGGQKEKVQPLVPAISQYASSLEQVARAKALPCFERDMETLRTIGCKVFINCNDVVADLRTAIVEKGENGHALAKAIAERPEQFAKLRGKSGLLGESKERKSARQYARVLGNHVAWAAETWASRLDEERRSERWSRQKLDVVEIPGMTSRSAGILTAINETQYEDKTRFLEKLLSTPEGIQALEEAKQIVRALERRFGSADLRHLEHTELRIGSISAADMARLKETARIADLAYRAELSQEYELKRSVNRTLQLGL